MTLKKENRLKSYILTGLFVLVMCIVRLLVNA